MTPCSLVAGYQYFRITCYSVMEMEAAYYFETLVFTRRYNQKCHNLKCSKSLTEKSRDTFFTKTVTELNLEP